MVRFKNRYLLCQLSLENDEIIEGLGGYSILGAITEQLLLLYGDAGAVLQDGLSVKYFSFHTNVAIIRTRKEHFKLIWAAITLMRLFRRRKCSFRVVHVAGTIKHAQIKTIAYDKECIDSLLASQRLTGAYI